MQLRHVAPVVALTLSGCVPFPHARQTKPAVDGVITVGGSPLAGAHVAYCAKGLNLDRCESFKEATTDGLGTFHFSGESTFEAFASLMGDPLYAFGITVTYNERKLSWGYGGVGYSPKHVFLRCEVSEKLSCAQEP
jgi:hypothetical protein